MKSEVTEPVFQVGRCNQDAREREGSGRNSRSTEQGSYNVCDGFCSVCVLHTSDRTVSSAKGWFLPSSVSSCLRLRSASLERGNRLTEETKDQGKQNRENDRCHNREIDADISA